MSSVLLKPLFIYYNQAFVHVGELLGFDQSHFSHVLDSLHVSFFGFWRALKCDDDKC